MAKENGVKKQMRRVAINMKVNIKMIKNLGLVLSHGSQAINIKVVIKRMKGTGMERCIGLMALITKGNGNMEFNTG
jgi:hypothetical protein